MDLENAPLRLLDRFPHLRGFCNWPHSALTSSLCTWLCELHKLMTANQTQMAVLMLLLLMLFLHVCLRVWHILLCFLMLKKCFYVLFIWTTCKKKSTVSLVSLFLCVCVSLFTVTRSTPAPILSTAMESASGPAVKHCVRTWDSSSSKLATNQKCDVMMIDASAGITDENNVEHNEEHTLPLEKDVCIHTKVLSVRIRMCLRSVCQIL